MPVTFQVVGNLADFGNDVRAGVKVRATATPGIKVGDVAVHSNQPETVVTDAAGAFVLELVSLPGVWYRIQTPYANAINTVNLAGYVPDVGDPTTGTVFPPGTVINLKDVVSEDPTPGYEAITVGATSVNGQVGAVVLDAADVGAATAAQGAKADAAVPNHKSIAGGYMPKPLRVPTLGVVDSWPNSLSSLRTIVWTENKGAVLYATAADLTLYKSTDSGATWAAQGYLPSGSRNQGCFLKTGANTLLTVTPATPPTILRSTDDGATWATAHTWRTSTLPLGSQSWAIDRVTGHLYYGEYASAATTTVNLYRSTDDGATWAIFHSWPGGLTAGADRVFHIHAVQWDHIAQRIVVCIGDSTADTGLWRVDAAGTGVEKMVTNSMLPAELIDAPRCIGIMPFPDYIVWASDSSANPALFRMNRDQIGLPAPTIERIYDLGSSSWFSCRASDDGTRWVFSTSSEFTTIDGLLHVYAVEDQGATVWEVGTLAPVAGAGVASLMPVGLPDIHDSTFFLTPRLGGKFGTWKFTLGYGAGTPIPWPGNLPLVPTWHTVNSGRVALAANEEAIFATDNAPSTARRLHIFNVTLGRQSGDSGSIDVIVRKTGTATSFLGELVSERYSGHKEWGGPIASYVFSAGSPIEFVIKNSSVANPAVGTATVVYGWGQ